MMGMESLDELEDVGARRNQAAPAEDAKIQDFKQSLAAAPVTGAKTTQQSKPADKKPSEPAGKIDAPAQSGSPQAATSEPSQPTAGTTAGTPPLNSSAASAGKGAAKGGRPAAAREPHQESQPSPQTIEQTAQAFADSIAHVSGGRNWLVAFPIIKAAALKQMGITVPLNEIEDLETIRKICYTAKLIELAKQ